MSLPTGDLREEPVVDGVDGAEGAGGELLDVDRAAAKLLEVEDEIHHLRRAKDPTLDDRRLVVHFLRRDLAARLHNPFPERAADLRFALHSTGSSDSTPQSRRWRTQLREISRRRCCARGW